MDGLIDVKQEGFELAGPYVMLSMTLTWDLQG